MMSTNDFDYREEDYAIDKLTLDFNRVKMIDSERVDERVKGKYITLDYKEQIIIDRKEQSLKQFIVIGSGCKIAHEYYVEGGIPNFLDSFDADSLFKVIPKTPDNVINNPDDVTMYRIKLDYDNGKNYEIEGIFDSFGLPEDYDVFVESLLGFMGFYNFGFGETLLKSNYIKRRRCEGEYIYLSVIFEEHGKTYYYRTEDDTIELGDFLLVEAGHDNHKTVVKVVDVEYFPEDKVPLPLDRTRTVLRRAVESDFENDEEE